MAVAGEAVAEANKVRTQCAYWAQEEGREADTFFDGGEWSSSMRNEHEPCAKCTLCIHVEEDDDLPF